MPHRFSLTKTRKFMNTVDKDEVVRTLAEQSVRIKVGMLRFKIRPLTFMQIQQMGVFANDIKEPTWKNGEKINIVPLLLEHADSARLMSEIFIVCAFRKSWTKWLFGRYIRRHLDVLPFNALIKFISSSFNANFFLTSIIFLTQTKIITEPTTTRHGQQSEE